MADILDPAAILALPLRKRAAALKQIAFRDALAAFETASADARKAAAALQPGCSVEEARAALRLAQRYDEAGRLVERLAPPEAGYSAMLREAVSATLIATCLRVAAHGRRDKESA